MALLERHIQKPSKPEDEYREWEKKWEAIEKRLGGSDQETLLVSFW